MTSQSTPQTASTADTRPTRRERPRLDGILPEKVVGGLVLLAIGIVLLAGRLVPGFGEYALLAVGVVCLVAFALTREYGYAVATGITGGLGVGIILTRFFTDPYDGVAFMAAFGGGFVVVWLLGLLSDPRETSPWPFIPAILFFAVAMTIVTETSVIFDTLAVVAIVALILGGLKAVRDTRRPERAGA